MDLGAPDRPEVTRIATVLDSLTHEVQFRRKGINNCHGAVYQIYRQENLGVERRKRRKRAANIRPTHEPARSMNERWSIDFVNDRVDTGRAFRVLTLIEHYTRECPILEPAEAAESADLGGAFILLLFCDACLH